MTPLPRGGAALGVVALLCLSPALAQQARLEEVRVVGHYDNSVGSSDAASQGVVGAALLENRPALRTGEILEYVPGMVVTQHSGDGKANQYFLRGFNLDHGTDFATRVDGMPVNLPTHGHGHGYTDLNFLMPELVERIAYRKGPYFADDGDFSTAGSADIVLRDRLERPQASIGIGEHGYGRLFAAGSTATAHGHWLAAFEHHVRDGPWVEPADLRRNNALLRYSERRGADRLSVTAMLYDSRWRATDQIPRRAIESGLIGRFGSLDPTDGGHSRRASLSANLHRPLADGSFEARAWALAYRMNLLSNFTWFLDDPVNGDQFEQTDWRRATGGELRRSWRAHMGGLPARHAVGLQWRHDRIDVGLHRTRAGDRLGAVRQDAVRQTSTAVFAESEIAWRPWLRTLAGLRFDRYWFDVDAMQAENTGGAHAGRMSPKLSAILGPWARTELFVNWGRGFHSNDARGTVTRVDPATGDPAEPVPGLVPASGFELGLRTEAIPGLQSSLSLWQLETDSELVFVGDAGTTEAGRPARRRGIEFGNRYTPAPWLVVDADLAWTRARFTDGDPAGDRIPGAVERVASIAVTVRDGERWLASLQLRHLGARPLVEDDSMRAGSASLVNLRLGWRLNRHARLRLDVFNLFDRKANDIEYAYESRLPGEAAPVFDRHLHPVEPRTARLALLLDL
jgi:outer membrane receptor protein involved in Fe transport